MIQVNPVQNTSQQDATTTTSLVSNTNNISGNVTTGKEKEVIPSTSGDHLKIVEKSVQIPPEVEKAGIIHFKETVDIPPDVRKLGVTHAGSTTPVSVVTLPKIVLPISDQVVFLGLHQHISNAVRWLAVWCLKKLKKAHVALKKVHGRIIRIRI